MTDAPDGRPWRDHIDDAVVRLRDRVRRTPLLCAPALDEAVGAPVWLKPENLQVTGSFKVRPALNGMLAVADAARERGVVTSSSGNFAAATAWAAREIGAKATIVMTPSTAPSKVANTERYGGIPHFCEDDYDAREATVARLLEETGAVSVHPHSSIETIAGDATCGREILEQCPDVANILVPVSGGGILAGIALAAAHSERDVKVWGVQAAGNDSMVRTFATGEVQSTARPDTIADGLKAKRPGPMSVPIVLEHVAGVVAVSDDAIREAVAFLASEQKLVVEPSGAVTVAALRTGALALEGPTVCVLTGGNA